MTAGTLHDTYVAALQHDLADLPDGATLVGVVRRPTRWFSPAVDENRPALAPPASLLDEFGDRRDELEAEGTSETEAHDAAWDDVEFAARYRAHLDSSPDARDAVDDLLARLRDGEDLALVCYENTDEKRCHRTILRDHLEERRDG
ncbi:DUF488 domain-containing protein [Halostella sp. JP-L12]|uniref:DUF488 domain-containing protein n=1 Tax=Halostella TaxID=1843185 RepID=UPI000EF8455C|nr:MULTISPECIES: DUF488 domain-containing protein [Halostella]NHN46866.1 DUF488 domain-containing protein [Halostella sp. JP-L12]